MMCSRSSSQSDSVSYRRFRSMIMRSLADMRRCMRADDGGSCARRAPGPERGQGRAEAGPTASAFGLRAGLHRLEHVADLLEILHGAIKDARIQELDRILRQAALVQ